MQAMFGMVKGVDSAGPGYAGGTTKDPTYEAVCTETTGYAETIQIIFDPKVVSYHDLLVMYFHAINPTELNRQGDDEGTSYRSAIFYHNAAQKADVEKTIAEINASHLYQDPIVTQVVPYTGFYPAESYHNNYYANNPDTEYCRFVVAPKVAHFKELYGAKLK
jgi:peptide-methionine (S)-S-oxide reductase